jgi:Family of unknown function (DUF5990)
VLRLAHFLHNHPVQIRIEGTDLPGRSCGPSSDRPDGYHNVHVGVQRRNHRDELLGLVPGDDLEATWAFDCDAVAVASGFDVRGPYVQGPPGGRFIYLSWVTVEADESMTLFRRAKLFLDAVPHDVMSAAVDLGLLVGRLALTDSKGHPVCAAVRPPRVVWSALAAGG